MNKEALKQQMLLRIMFASALLEREVSVRAGEYSKYSTKNTLYSEYFSFSCKYLIAIFVNTSTMYLPFSVWSIIRILCTRCYSADYTVIQKDGIILINVTTCTAFTFNSQEALILLPLVFLVLILFSFTLRSKRYGKL